MSSDGLLILGGDNDCAYCKWSNASNPYLVLDGSRIVEVVFVCRDCKQIRDGRVEYVEEVDKFYYYLQEISKESLFIMKIMYE